jgi:hypothetical protein
MFSFSQMTAACFNYGRDIIFSLQIGRPELGTCQPCFPEIIWGPFLGFRVSLHQNADFVALAKWTKININHPAATLQGTRRPNTFASGSGNKVFKEPAKFTLNHHKLPWVVISYPEIQVYLLVRT